MRKKTSKWKEEKRVTPAKEEAQPRSAGGAESIRIGEEAAETLHISAASEAESERFRSAIPCSAAGPVTRYGAAAAAVK